MWSITYSETDLNARVDTNSVGQTNVQKKGQTKSPMDCKCTRNQMSIIFHRSDNNTSIHLNTLL